MQISKYFASMGIEVDKASIKKVDKALDHVENRLKKLSTFNKPIVLNIGNFDVDQRRLNIALGNALDMASQRLVFEVSHFAVNQAALNRSVGSALNRASATQTMHVNQRGSTRAAAGAAVGGGLIGRGVSGLYGPAIALGLGGYGLGALNQRNQQVVAAQLQTNAVVQQAGGTAAEGGQAFSWLREQGQRVGFNYLEAAPDYAKLLSGLTGAGMSVKEGQGVYKGFAELSRVNKLDRVQQQRVFRALSQIAGKNKLQSEELQGQLAESLPGAVSLFARAYQAQTGGNKTGQEAITELLAAMKKGQVKGSILTYAGQLASQQAQPGLAAASTASQAEQARYQNSLSDLAIVASNAGVEEGFARIFRTLNAGLSESNDLVKVLAEGFNEATKWADDLLLWPQSFVRALEGKDSLVADWLGKDNIEQLKQDWKDIKQIFADISSIKFDFLPDLKSTSEEVAKIMNAIAEFQRWKSGTSTTTTTNLEDIPSIDPFGLGSYKSPIGIAEAVLNNTGVNLNRAKERQQAIYGDPSSIFYHNPADYDVNQKNMAMDMAKEQATSTVTSNQFDIKINIDPVTLANVDVKSQAEDLGNWFRGELEKVSVNFPIKE